MRPFMTKAHLNSYILIIATIYGFIFCTLQQSLAETNYVPFVSCKSDGQTGPASGPNGNPKPVKFDQATAAKLAYYQGTLTEGVLAPRGWYCFGLYGAHGSTLFVTPQPHEEKFYYEKIDGPIITISMTSGDTGGRFAVARVVAHIFPAHKDYVEKIIKEGIEPLSNFPYGIFPNDKLTYLDDRNVEYETPKNSQGIGTFISLSADNLSIKGAAMLVNDDFDLVTINIKLPEEMAAFSNEILHYAETEQMARSK